MKKVGILAGGSITGLLVLFLFIFTIVRVDVPPDMVLVATRLSGKDLPEGHFIALEEDQKGVMLKPYNEGFHWFNPYTYRTEIVNSTIIKPGEVGVLIRLFGDDLPGSRLVASPGLDKERGAKEVYKGVLRESLGPGKYNINTRAYQVERYPAITVPNGFVGVSINTGDALAPSEPTHPYINDKEGFKGVSPKTRQPGTYYLNPYCEQLVLYEVRAQRFDFIKTPQKDGSIDFQSSDAFTLNMEGTIEWAIDPELAPELICRLGELNKMIWTFDHPTPNPRLNRPSPRGRRKARRPAVVKGQLALAKLDVLVQKVLVPYTRSYVRMLGAKYKASEYISGERRMEIQKDFRARLEERCKLYGMKIRNVAISKIMPPSKIKEIINNRSLQKEQRNRIVQNIEKLRSDANLKKKQESIRKSQLMVDANTTAEKRRIRARQDRNVSLKKIEGELAVAKINKNKAEIEKERYVIDERARIDQAFKKEEAQIQTLALEVSANGGGNNYIRSIFVRKMGSGLRDVVTNDDSFFMKMFEDVLNYRGDKKPKLTGPERPPVIKKKTKKKTVKGGAK
jgi:regulator of protease activity HflC (stomatin/prohibitin superfamily)